jgi:hypothetical protein
MSETDREIERIDAGGDAWQDTEAVEQVAVKRPLDAVIPVRLSSETWTALRQEARQLGIGPSTLVRMWVLEKLRERTPAR